MYKKALAMFLAVVLLFCGVPTRANAEGGVKARIDALTATYPSGSVWSENNYGGAVECYGFVRLVVNNVFGKVNGYYRDWNYYGTDGSMSGFEFIGSTTDYSEASIRELLKNAKVGDVLQFSPPRPHSMLIYSLSEDTVGIYDCNWFSYLEINIRQSPYGKWNGRNSTRLGLYRATNYAEIDGSEPGSTTPAKPTEKPTLPADYITTADSGLHMRAEASLNGEKVGLIPLNTKVRVTKISGNWGYTSYNGTSGWISLDYVKPASSDEPTTQPKPSEKPTDYITTADHGLRIRNAAGMHGEQIGLIPPNTKISVTKISGNWGYTSYNGTSGWISLDYAQALSLGDLNNDGKITAADARIALRLAAKLEKQTDRHLQYGDVNADGKITSADARQLLRYAAHLITAFSAAA